MSMPRDAQYRRLHRLVRVLDACQAGAVDAADVVTRTGIKRAIVNADLQLLMDRVAIQMWRLANDWPANKRRIKVLRNAANVRATLMTEIDELRDTFEAPQPYVHPIRRAFLENRRCA